MQELHYKSMVTILVFMVIGTTVLVILNTHSPGLCPPYPIIGAPACIVVDLYFAAILGSLFFKSQLSDIIFYIATGMAFLTSVFFSAKEIMDLSRCPRLFDIPVPLCFTVFPTMVLLAYLKYRGHTKYLFVQKD
jgi:hypothetical protein